MSAVVRPGQASDDAATTPMLTVSTAVLDRLEDSLYEVEVAVGAIAEILKNRLTPEHIPFVTSTLMAALDENVTRCFDAMSAGALLRSERHLLETAHAPRS